MEGIYDIHCHILPGVDDGAGNIKEAMELIEMEYQDGVRVIYLTPHFREGMFETPMGEIIRQYNKIKERAEATYPKLRLELGCEFRVNFRMIEYLQDRKRPTLGKSRYVLAEFSGKHEFSYIRERCYDLLSHGYKPIIAHAERYNALYGQFERLEQLSQMGALIQLNAGSILGIHGLQMKRFCRKVMRLDLLDFVGSDAHNIRDRKPMMGKCAEYMEKKMGRGYTKRVLVRNPRDYIEEGRIEAGWK